MAVDTVSTIQYTLVQLVVSGSRGGSTTIQLLHHPWSLLIIAVYYRPVHIYICTIVRGRLKSTSTVYKAHVH